MPQAKPDTPQPTAPLALGRYYLRPCIRASWPMLHLKVRWVPVLGPPHDDAEIIGFKPRHYHVDFRFLPADLRRRVSVPKSVHSAHQMPLHWIRPTGHDQPIQLGEPRLADLPRERWYQLRRLRFNSHYPDYPRREAAWLDKLHQAYRGDRLRGEDLICPHRGASLSGIYPDPDGFVTCPLHGLRFHPETGRVLEHWRPETDHQPTEAKG